MHYCIVQSNFGILSGRAKVYSCNTSAWEWYVIKYNITIADLRKEYEYQLIPEKYPSIKEQEQNKNIMWILEVLK